MVDTAEVIVRMGQWLRKTKRKECCTKKEDGPASV